MKTEETERRLVHVFTNHFQYDYRKWVDMDMIE